MWTCVRAVSVQVGLASVVAVMAVACGGDDRVHHLPPGDDAALGVSLAVSETSVTAPGSVSLTATPSAGASVPSIELFEGQTSLGAVTTSPYTFDVTYAAPNNGAHTYHAVLTDPAGQTATSNDVTVTVNIVAPSFYVDATGGLDTNACSLAAPCKTISHTVAGAPAGTTVVLLDGTFASATQGATVTVPDGITLSAQHPGLATLTGFAITFSGSGGLDSLVIDPGASVTAASTTGTPTLAITGVLWRTLGGLVLGGNVQATMAPGALAGALYTAALPAGGNFIVLGGGSQLAITGGIIDGNNQGDATTGGGFILLNGSSQLTLDAVTVRNRTSEVVSASGTSALTPVQITLQNGTVLQSIGGLATASGGVVVRVSTNAALSVSNTQFRTSPSAVAIGGYSAFDHVSIALGAGTVIDGALHGVSCGGAAVPGTGLVLAVDGATFRNITNRAILYNGTGSIDVANATFDANTIDIETYNLPMLRVRSSTFTRTASNTGILANDVPADLGTTASPGGNTFTNTAGSVFVVTSTAAVTIDAVGNTWNANQQGADAMGHYPAATQLTGLQTGRNFAVTSTNVTLNL